MTPASSDIAMAFIRHKVLDIRRQNSKAVQHISLPKLTAFLACKENLSKIKAKLVALEALQNPEDSE
jgi:hypothetical protein